MLATQRAESLWVAAGMEGGRGPAQAPPPSRGRAQCRAARSACSAGRCNLRGFGATSLRAGRPSTAVGKFFRVVVPWPWPWPWARSFREGYGALEDAALPASVSPDGWPGPKTTPSC